MSFRLILVQDGDESPREDNKLDYLPSGVRTLKLRVEGGCKGKVRVQPARLSCVPGETFGHEDEGIPPQFIVSWGGGYEDHCELDYPRKPVVHLLVHHAGDSMDDRLLTVEATDESGCKFRLPVTLTYPRSGGVPWPADQLVRPTWQEVSRGLGGTCSIQLQGDLTPRYVSRWWPQNRIVYTYDKHPPRVRLSYRRLADQDHGELMVYASRPDDAEEILLAELRGSIGTPLYDMRQVIPQLFRFGPRTWALRVWFLWLDLEISREDLARYWPRDADELELAWRGITGKRFGGVAERSWQQLHEIPDAERVDIVFDDNLQPLYAATDLHWRELWGQYAPRASGEPVLVQVMNTRAKELARNWQELGKAVEGWSQVILNRFARNNPPYAPHREVMAELRGEGKLAADPIGMESHTPSFFNVKIQRHLTSTDVRDAEHERGITKPVSYHGQPGHGGDHLPWHWREAAEGAFSL
jgi:hypothetical protein